MNNVTEEEELVMILVTGAAGYIGSYFIKHLTENGHTEKIKAVDNFECGHHERVNDIKIDKLDLTDIAQVQSIMKDVSIVVHCAGISSIPECEKDSQRAILANLLAVRHLLEEGAKNGLKKIIFPSSFSVYAPGQARISERSALGPYHFYGHLKLWAEMLIQSYKNSHRIDYVIFRQTNVCGKGLSYKNNVVHAMCQAVKNDQPITIYGDGRQTRNFIHIKDVVHYYRLAMKDQHQGIYNLGGHETKSINNIARLIADRGEQTLKKKVRIIHLPSDREGRELTTPDFVCDISKLINDFHYSPRHSIQDIIQEDLEA